VGGNQPQIKIMSGISVTGIIHAVKRDPSGYPSFLKSIFTIVADERADYAVTLGAKLLTRLRNRRFNRIEWSKMHLQKLGLPLWSNLTITGNFNLNMVLKIKFKKINAPMDL
jgi:hypothetical protein